MTKVLQGKVTSPGILCLIWCPSSWADVIGVKYHIPLSRSHKKYNSEGTRSWSPVHTWISNLVPHCVQKHGAWRSFLFQHVCHMGITGQGHFLLLVIEGTRSCTMAFGIKTWFHLCSLNRKVTCCLYLSSWVGATIVALLEKFPMNSRDLVSR